MRLTLRFLCLPVLLALAGVAVWAQARQNVGVTYRRDPPLLNEVRGDSEARTEVDVSYTDRGTVPVPGPEVLDLKRPREDYPALLAPTDFFGSVKKPATNFFDPFNSSSVMDGQPTAPGDRPMLKKEHSLHIQMEPWALPTVSVAEEVWTTLILMREGEVVFPRSLLIGNQRAIEAKKSVVKESPYVYLRSKPGRTSKNGGYLHTTLDIEVVDKQDRVFVYKFDVQIVPLRHQDYFPTVKADMVETTLPPIYGTEGSRYADTPPASPVVASAQVGSTREEAPFAPGSAGFADGRKFTQEDTRRYFPTMIGMAKAYDEAVRAGAKGYTAKSIMPFHPATIVIGVEGRPEKVSGKVPAFRNPYDGQVYFVLRSFFYPQYDAILYDVSVRNRSNETLWWDYSQLRIIPGFESSDAAATPTVVSPEFGETTPPGKVNTLWVLVQGRGWLPSTPIRLMFPSRGMEARIPQVVQPHISTPPQLENDQPIKILRPDMHSVFTP